MSNNHRELTGREKQRIKKLITSLCANHDKEYGCLPLDYECPMFGICYTNSALCSYFRKSVLPEDAELEADSPAHQPPTASNAANRSPLMGNGCTARNAVPKKHAASRPQHGCVSIGRKTNRCNCFALEKPCAARLFGGHFCVGKVFILLAHF